MLLYRTFIENSKRYCAYAFEHHEWNIKNIFIKYLHYLKNRVNHAFVSYKHDSVVAASYIPYLQYSLASRCTPRGKVFIYADDLAVYKHLLHGVLHPSARKSPRTYDPLPSLKRHPLPRCGRGEKKGGEG